MSIDRLQIRQDALTRLAATPDPLARHCIALLKELEQAEFDARDWQIQFFNAKRRLGKMPLLAHLAHAIVDEHLLSPESEAALREALVDWNSK